MDNEKKKYRLYAIPYSDEAVKEAIQHRFNRINRKYILIYECDELVYVSKTAYHIIEQNEIDYLSEAEQLWLIECNTILIAEETEKNSEQIMQSFSEKLIRLEEELKKEAEGLKDGTDSTEK